MPAILVNGPEWYKAKGTEDTKGTKILQVVGQVKRPGVVEANLGMPLRELIDKYGGGVRDGRTFKACQPGGASVGFILDEHLDTPIEHAALAKIQGGLGSGTMLVMDDTVCVIDVVKCLLYFFQHESCGFCLPCRRGTRVLYEMICKVAAGQGHPGRPGPDADPGPDHGGFRQLRPGMEPVFLPQDHHGALQGRIRRPPGGQLPPGGVQGGRAFALAVSNHGRGGFETRP